MGMMKIRGFTLIEVLIVVVIIGILAALIIPRLVATPEKAILAEASHMLGAIIRAQLARTDLGQTPVQFTCAVPPSFCGQTSALTSLGLNDFPQKNFRYRCNPNSGNYYCMADRTGTANANIYVYYIYPSSPTNEGKWHCENGYVTQDTGSAGFSSKGCRPNW